MRFQNTPRDFSTNAPPGERLATQGLPAPQGVKRGHGGREPSPPKAGNPAPSFLGPWLILPLAIAAWGALGVLVALGLHLVGGG